MKTKKFNLIVLCITVVSLCMIFFLNTIFANPNSELDKNKEKDRYLHDIEKAKIKKKNNKKPIKPVCLDIINAEIPAYENTGIFEYNGDILLPIPSAVLKEYKISNIVFFENNLVIFGSMANDTSMGIIMNRYTNPKNPNDVSMTINKIPNAGKITAQSIDIKNKKIKVLCKNLNQEQTIAVSESKVLHKMSANN